MKEKSKLSRMDAVHRLEDLARQIEHGTIQVGAKSFAVADDVRLQIKAHRDDLEIELKWRPATQEKPPPSDDQTDEPTAPAR